MTPSPNHAPKTRYIALYGFRTAFWTSTGATSITTAKFTESTQQNWLSMDTKNKKKLGSILSYDCATLPKDMNMADVMKAVRDEKICYYDGNKSEHKPEITHYDEANKTMTDIKFVDISKK
jgi:hypothetical protein